VFSRRSAHDPSPNALAQALAARRAARASVLDLTESNPTRAGVPYGEHEILRALAKTEALRYEPEPFGLRSAREAVAREHGFDAERVVLTASTSEAYGFLFKLFCDPGDEVLAPAPSYPLFDQLATFDGVALRPYRVAYDGAWHVDLASVRAAVGPRTRAILAVSPNNPTGSFLSKDELGALRATGLPVVCDEVFASYTLRPDAAGRRVQCAAREKGEGLVFSLGGLSKLAALPQMKLAWMLVGGEARAAGEALGRLGWIADGYLSVGTPVQHALPELLAARASAHDAICARTRRNLAALARAASGSAVTVLDVEGGWYATLQLPAIEPEMTTCLRALDRGVYVHPGAFFGFEREAFLVVSLLTPEAVFDEGVALLLSAISA